VAPLSVYGRFVFSFFSKYLFCVHASILFVSTSISLSPFVRVLKKTKNAGRQFVGGAAPASGGVLLDDIVVSAAPLPACPEVLAPAQGAFLSTLPQLIQWTEVHFVRVRAVVR
jgi:hypothetical protein